MSPFRPLLEILFKIKTLLNIVIELQRIESVSYSICRLMTVKDLFVFGYYTRMFYADIMKLKRAHIITGIDGNNWIITERLKTKIPVNIPLLSVVESLIEKYGDHPRTIILGGLKPYLLAKS